MLKFKVGDSIEVTSGKDKGQKGVIEKIFPEKMLALVPNVNMYKKHVKGSQGQQGGVFGVPRPLSFAKIALVCPSCKKTTRIGFSIIKDEKVRVCKKCGKEFSKTVTKGGKKK